MNPRPRADRRSRRRHFALALALGALLALLVPALAAAETYVVNGTGDKTLAEGAECTAAPLSECTLRAAIEVANGTAGADTIGFSPSVFNGEAGDTISPGLLPAISTPTTLDGTACNAGSSVPCLSAANTGGNALLLLSTGETKAEHLSLNVPSGVVGIRASGSAGSGPGVEVLDNKITMPGSTLPSTGIEISLGASGDLLEGNVIDASSNLSFNFPISLRGSSNLILGNELLGSGCCEAGITIELGAHGNQIGGDTAASENVIENFGNGAIYLNSSSNNEVRRNRGDNELSFINGAGVVQPAITEALQSSVSGTAEPGATVRLFRKATENAGEIEGFLGEATADAVTGDWKVTFAKAPTGTFVAATQTVSGSTSGLGETKALVEEPGAEEPETGGGGGSGGGSSGGGTTTTTTPPATTAPITTPAPVKPNVKITKGPKKTSTATTAKFTFKATNVSGAKFECKLDNAKWASCKSPKTYKKLKPKAHTFQVRAKAGGLTSAVVKFKFTVKP